MTCDNSCNKSCGDPCGCECRPAKYGCDFEIQANPFDPSIWNVTICGATTRVKIPKLNETDTKLSTNYTSRALIYNAERHTDIITGEQLGALIDLEDLRNTDTDDADSCDLLVFNPHCGECGDGCRPKNPMWKNYHIPDAGDCEIEVDDEGYYHILIKDDCGCIKECRLPAMPQASTVINYMRDSVPDDPDYPWYYGAYNDRINLYLEDNVPQWFGKYDLEVTVNYSIQVAHSWVSPNANFRSLILPVIDGMEPNPDMFSSTLQNQSTTNYVNQGDTGVEIPWGTVCMRGSFKFIAPKGKDAYLHHEFRLRTQDSASQAGPGNLGYASHELDRQKVPDDVAASINQMLYIASRLNALQIVVSPTRGVTNTTPPHFDAPREMLDPGNDNEYL